MDFIYRIAVVTALVVGSWLVMAFGAYLIAVLCFHLPLLFWRTRNERPISSSVEDANTTESNSTRRLAA